MGMKESLHQGWATLWVLRKQRGEPGWARVAVATALALSVSLALVMLAGLLRLSWFDPRWWQNVGVPLLAIGVAIGITLLGSFRTLELLAGEATLAHLRTDAGWRSRLVLNTLAAAAIVLGSAAGIGVLSLAGAPQAANWVGQSQHRIHFALVMLVLIAGNLIVWSLRARAQAARRRAAEAQLHLLQAQIEPQFLFNILADVQGLLDSDPERARAMLEEFTDYLRANLGQLRRADSTLASELEMGQCYLQLLRLRMGNRLDFSIDASAQARAAVVPPLLLQPLIENAIRHGLAPRADGGSVHIHAVVLAGRLVIAVGDDGVGLPATLAAGHGLDNIRARLQARYGSNASLTLAAQAPGTRALIDLPFVGAAVDPSHRD